MATYNMPGNSPYDHNPLFPAVGIIKVVDSAQDILILYPLVSLTNLHGLHPSLDNKFLFISVSHVLKVQDPREIIISLMLVSTM